MTRYPQQYLDVPQITMAVIATDKISQLPITSKGNKWPLAAICLQTFYIFSILMKEKSAKNVVQAYLSVILAHEGRGVAILGENGTEFKNKVLNEACDQLGIQRLLPNLFHPQGNAKAENVHNFLKQSLIKFLGSSHLE